MNCILYSLKNIQSPIKTISLKCIPTQPKPYHNTSLSETLAGLLDIFKP